MEHLLYYQVDEQTQISKTAIKRCGIDLIRSRISDCDFYSAEPLLNGERIIIVLFLHSEETARKRVYWVLILPTTIQNSSAGIPKCPPESNHVARESNAVLFSPHWDPTIMSSPHRGAKIMGLLPLGSKKIGAAGHGDSVCAASIISQR